RIRNQCAGDADEGGNVAAQVQQGVQLDSCSGVSCRCPSEQTQAQIDGARIDGVYRLGQLHCQAVARIQRAGDANQMQREVLKDAAIAPFVGLGQRRARDAAAKAGVVQLGGVATQARDDVTQALPRSQLRKHHAQQLIPVREL